MSSDQLIVDGQLGILDPGIQQPGTGDWLQKHGTWLAD